MSTLDLTILRIFCAVIETGSVTRAAARLSISQPSVSYALSRLRVHFQDPLFLRVQSGMVPTQAALRLYERLSQGIELLDNALAPETFDPQVTQRVFRIALSDIGELTFLPIIVRALQCDAPHVTCESVQVSRADVPRALELGEIDFAIGNLPEIMAETAMAMTFRETYVCVRRKDHSRIGRRLTGSAYEEALHILVPSSFSEHEKIVHSALREQGIERRAGLRVAHFTSVPDVIANTDLLATLPSRVARRFVETHGLVFHELPVKIPKFDVRVHWSRRHEHKAAHRWLRLRLLDWLKSL